MRVLESNSCLMIIVGFNLFRDSFSMISMVLKYFIKFYRNIIAHGVSHSIERRSISGRPNYFLGGVKRQPSFFYHVSASASKRDEGNPVF